MENVYVIFFGKIEKKRTLRTISVDGNVEINYLEIYEDMDGIRLAKERNCGLFLTL
jgi:hypothetical protein